MADHLIVIGGLLNGFDARQMELSQYDSNVAREGNDCQVSHPLDHELPRNLQECSCRANFVRQLAHQVWTLGRGGQHGDSDRLEWRAHLDASGTIWKPEEAGVLDAPVPWSRTKNRVRVDNLFVACAPIPLG